VYPLNSQGRRRDPRKKTTPLVRGYVLEDIVAAVQHVLARHNISRLLLLTDGHLRNGTDTVRAFSEPFGARLQTINGSVPADELEALLGAVPLQHPFVKLAALERKVCASADLVLASSVSSFAWEIMFDHARHDPVVLQAVAAQVRNYPSNSYKNQEFDDAMQQELMRTLMDPGFRSTDPLDALSRNKSLNYQPDLREASEKRSNVYYLETMLARFVDPSRVRALFIK
jgi:hypothetical protein